MGYAVRMPQMGMTMQEGAVVEWGVDEGSELNEGDVVCVVESEKTTNEVYAREAGVLREQFVDLEQAVEPGTPIAFVGAEDEAIPDAIRDEVEATGAPEPDADEAPTPATPEGEPTPDEGPSEPAAEAKVSPRARRYARENDIPTKQLQRISGSGPDGAVVEDDVITAVERGDIGGGAEPVGQAAAGRDIYESREGSRLRQTIAERMTQSAREAPQVTLNRRIPIEQALAFRDQLETDRGIDLSLTDLLIAAVAEALEAHPEFNAIYEDDVHKLARNVNVGLAVDIDDGLVTPVLSNAQDRRLHEISQERSRLVQLAQSRDYSADDLAGGTFTITNLGLFDIEYFDPLLNPPQVGILGVGAIQEGELPVSLTFDHRAVDGADAARFIASIAEALAHPLRLDDRGTGSDEESPTQTPGGGGSPERVAQAHSPDGMRATVSARNFEWQVDEPAERGGTDTGPTPVENFLGSLASCLALSVRAVADRRDIPVDDIDVTADADPDEGRIEHIDLTVRLGTDVDEETAAQVVETAERVCYVNNVVSDDIDRSVAVELQ